jgi:two-component system, LytTR family, sensor kinase
MGDEPTPLTTRTDHWQSLSALKRAMGHSRPSSPLRRRWRWSFYFLGWTIVGLLFTAPLIAGSIAARAIPWSQIVSELLRWYLWAALAPFIFWQAQRFPLERGRILWRLPINLLFGLFLTLVYTALDLVLRQLLTSVITAYKTNRSFDFSFLRSWKEIIAWGVEYNVLVYLAVAGVIHAFLYYDKYRERELKATRLEAQLALVRLEVLKTQLHPHFLFNTLNAISALMHRDVEAADRMIVLLADLLRLSLDQDDRHLVPLRNELEFLERYLAIEKIRFRDRLRVEIDIESSCFAAHVPRLILQPLVENSVRHGIARSSSAGLVAVRARRKGNRLDLSVTDDGPGLPEAAIRREGVGLSNTRARLDQIYGTDHRFGLEQAPTGGLLVRIEVPFEENPRDPVGHAT